MDDRNVSHIATKITAKDRAMQFPDLIYESEGKLFCTACNVVLEHKRKSSINKHFTTAKHIRRVTENHGHQTRQITATEAVVVSTSVTRPERVKGENPAMRFLRRKGYSMQNSLLQKRPKNIATCITIFRTNCHEIRGKNLKPRISNAKRFPCTAPSENTDQYPELMEFLPKKYQYHICNYKEVNMSSDHTDFEATLRMSLTSKEEILVWLKLMPVTWRVDYTRPTKGSKVIFKTEYRCQHNTRPRATQKSDRTSKNTDCPAKLKVTIARTEVSDGRRSRSTDPHIPNYPTLVDIVNVHNHNIHAPDALRHRDVGSKAVEELTELFKAGHSPSSALNVLKHDLQVQFGNDYINASADRSICPDLQFCYRLYYKMFQREYMCSAGDDDHLHEGFLKPVQDQDCSIKVSGGSHPTVELSDCGPETSVEAAEELEVDETLEARVSAQEWDSMSQEFAVMVQSTEEFQVAGSAFLKAFNRLKGNPSMIQAAMHMFGRCDANNLALKQSQHQRQAANHNAVAGQRGKLRGRRQLAAGRNKGATMDHRYSILKGAKSGTQSVSSCRGVSQQPRTMDVPSPYPSPSSPLLRGWTHDHCAPYQEPSP